jgi:hypothetical protein
VPREILRVFNTILYENEFQNPELFPTQVSLSPEQSTLHLLLFSAKQFFTGKLPVLRFEKTGFYRPR